MNQPIRSARITHCRVCDAPGLNPILHLGSTALANRFLRAEQLTQPEPSFPLRLVLCPKCGCVQIDETVDPQALFGDYVYVTGTSEQIHTHIRRLAADCVDRFGLETTDLVCEIASNDGTVLREFQRHGVRTLGIEPAENIARTARAAGVPTRTAFFNDSVAREVRAESGPAKLILGRHVLAHVAELHSFMAGVRHLLSADGVALFEVPHLLPFFENAEFDTIYHEHLCYFSVRVLSTLAGRHGLEVFDVAEADVHGGSVIVAMQPKGGPRFATTDLHEMLARESAAGLHQMAPWHDFRQRVNTCRSELFELAEELSDRGQTLAAYGAAAKGMTLLTAAKLSAKHVIFVADRNPLKQGLFTPGHHVPVVPPERIAEQPPDVLLILAWNFADEIMRQQAAFAAGGGRFVVPHRSLQLPARRWG